MVTTVAAQVRNHTVQAAARHSLPVSLITRPPAQLRSHAALEARLLQRAGRCANGEQLAGAVTADALLLVSGSHPVRDLLAPTGLLPDALYALRKAVALRAAGRLPSALSLWAVANPLTESAARSAAKVTHAWFVVVAWEALASA